MAQKAVSGKKRVLVVEDDDETRELLSRMLKLNGYTVTPAKNGLEALSIIGREDFGFDIILLDLMMPGLDGIEVARTLKHFVGTKIPIIPVTAKEIDARVLEQFGMGELVPKPVVAGQLFDVIQKAILENASN